MKASAIALGLVFCIISSAGAATKAVKPIFADLDGDGKKEKIWITAIPDPKFAITRCTLHVDKAELKLALDSVINFSIVDINRADHYKELDIEVHFSGIESPSHLIYWYDGKNIVEIYTLDGGVSYNSNGIVLNRTWNGMNLALTVKYVLNTDRKLVFVPQEIYYVGIVHTVTKSFPIYYSRTSKEVVANLETNSKITIVGYAPISNPKARLDENITQDWLLIKSQYGLMGWAQQQTVSKCVEGMEGIAG